MPERFYVDQGRSEFLVFRAASVPDDVAERLTEFTSIDALIIALRSGGGPQ